MVRFVAEDELYRQAGLTPTYANNEHSVRQRLPRTVILLGLVSFFNDLASDMVIPLIPIVLAGVLSAGPVALGLIEGVADAVESFLKLWAGRHCEDLVQENMLLLGNGHCFRDQVLKFCPALNRSAATPDGLQQTLITTSLETIRYMVASGAGITVLPVTSVGGHTDSKSMLSIVPFAKPVPDRRVALVWRTSFTRLDAVEAVRQAILSARLPGVSKLDGPPSMVR